MTFRAFVAALVETFVGALSSGQSLADSSVRSGT